MAENNQITIRPFDDGMQEYTNPDFYQILWMKEKFRFVKIDDEQFDACSNLICFITPGRRVSVHSKKHSSGWILQFSKPYFSERIRENLLIKEAELLSAFGQIPKIILSPKIGDRVHGIAEMIDELSGSAIPNRESGIASLLKTLLVYCDSRCNIRLSEDCNQNNIQLVAAYKDLVVENYIRFHKVKEYAKLLHISPKHLNRAVKEVLGVTAKSIIKEQLLIHARHELKFSGTSVKEIAFSLGFSEPFHFSNFFKTNVGSSPDHFRRM